MSSEYLLQRIINLEKMYVEVLQQNIIQRNNINNLNKNIKELKQEIKEIKEDIFNEFPSNFEVVFKSIEIDF